MKRGEEVTPAPKVLQGIGASEGIVFGPVQLLTTRVVVVGRSVAPELIPAEVDRLSAAIEATDRQLVLLSQRLEAEGHDDGHLIVDAHRLILKSDELMGAALALVAQEGLAAESAVRRVVDDIVAAFERMTNRYLRERGGDVEAVGDRLIATLLGLPESAPDSGKLAGAIGVGMALSPIDGFQMHRLGLAGLVTERGGKTSHAAIIVRGFGLPYVVGVKNLLASVRAGDTILVDGTSGEVIVNPSPETTRLFRERERKARARAPHPPTLPGGRTSTIDDTCISVAANIEDPSEIPAALELGADSVGLFRTELVYLDRLDLPTEEEQYRDAVTALEQLGGRMATFRTLDLGGEKLPLGLKLPEEPNPSLGVRGIRLSLRRPEIFVTQLRALYRASTRGPLRIMFPLVSGISELTCAQQLCADVREQLTREHIPFDPGVPIGAMIETPSAALTADHLAQRCDFLSVGTNDLIQYAFAADRENQDVSHLYHPLHPAVLRLLWHAIDGAAHAHKPLSICGDMAGDPAFTWVLLGLGFRELSMAPRSIPRIRALIMASRLLEARELAQEVLQLHSEEAVEERVRSVLARRFPPDPAGDDAPAADIEPSP